MTIKIKKLLAFVIIIGVAIGSCTKREFSVFETNSTQGSAFVRFVHAAPNFRTVIGNRDSFNIYNRTLKLNSTFLTFNSAFPALTVPNYVSVPVGDADKQTAGLTPFRFSLNGVLSPDSLTIHSFSNFLSANRYYSLIITDSIKSTNPNKQMFLEDNFTVPAVGTYGVRLIHAVHNDTAAGRTVDLFSAKNKTNIFTNVPIGSATGFLYFPVATTGGGDTLILRRSGTNYEIARINAITQSSTRVYSILYKGSALAASPKNRSLTSYINY